MEILSHLLNIAGAGCWVMCFIWMYRISKRQDATLTELREMAERIESLSREEHDLIKEVHPQVSEIKEKVEDVAETVKTN